MSKSRETYHTEKTEFKETKRDKTEKLSIKIKKQTNWILMEVYIEREVVFEKRR